MCGGGVYKCYWKCDSLELIYGGCDCMGDSFEKRFCNNQICLGIYLQKNMYLLYYFN